MKRREAFEKDLRGLRCPAHEKGLVSNRTGVPATDEERRRMRALQRLLRDADELFDIGAAVAHVQAKIEKGTN